MTYKRCGVNAFYETLTYGSLFPPEKIKANLSQNNDLVSQNIEEESQNTDLVSQNNDKRILRSDLVARNNLFWRNYLIISR